MRESLLEIALKPSLQPALSGTDRASFLSARLELSFAPWSGINDVGGSIGDHASLPLARQPKNMASVSLPKKPLAIFVEAPVLAIAMAD